MDLRELLQAVLTHDMLTARQWVTDAIRAGFRWEAVGQPEGLDPVSLALAASLVELMAERTGRRCPSWTAAVPAAPERLFLVEAARVLPRLRRLCEEEGPEPLRRRRFLAPPDFLTAA